MKPVEGSGVYGPCIDTIYESDLDEENNSGTEAPALLERRRKLHTEAEQRRRNSIKLGFQALFELVHPVKNGAHSSSIRMSKSTILLKSINAIEKTDRQIYQKTAEVKKLDLEVQTLRILNACYEKYAHRNSQTETEPVTPISEEMKLQVFQMFTDTLFNSFDAMVKLAPLQEFSGSIINWIETSCKPEKLSQVMQFVLSCAFNGSSDPTGAYVVAPENPARRMSNASGTWINPSGSGDWASPSTSFVGSGRSSHDWLQLPSFGPVAPMISPSSSSSTSSSAQRYGAQHEVSTRDTTVPFTLDRGHASLTDPIGPNNRPMKMDSSVHVYPISHPNESTSQALDPSACCVPDINLSTEQCPSSCFPSQAMGSDTCFPVHNAAVKFDHEHPRLHSLSTTQSTAFNSRITDEEASNTHTTCNNNGNRHSLSGPNNNHSDSTTSNNNPSSSVGNSNNNSLSASLTTASTSVTDTQHQNQCVNSAETNSTFRSHFAYTTESLGEPAPTNRAVLDQRRAFQTEPSHLGDLRVRYKQFF
ncbi:Max protein X [Fasciola gigantica]|uniref:Max protein X n=1 Tax=Fasciola gigantica TaxID=46835 RepID=A0A504YFK5_FASGI|nr:Max protein X [Fasciola gigantica]